MQLSIAALSTIAKCWSQHKYTRTRIVFFNVYWTPVCAAGPRGEYESTPGLCWIWDYSVLFCFLSIWNKYHTPPSGSPVYHRVGIHGIGILDTICILPTRCVCMRFGRQKGGERGPIILPPAPVVDTWALSGVSFCRNQRNSYQLSTQVLCSSWDHQQPFLALFWPLP